MSDNCFYHLLYSCIEYIKIETKMISCKAKLIDRDLQTEKYNSVWIMV
jgi:hypothetical protein